jgi:hypothetical protein
MKFRELLKESGYKQVFNVIYKHYYKDKNYSEDDIISFDLLYRKAFDTLLNKDTNDSNSFEILLQDIKAEEEDIIDVCIKDLKTEEIFALDFIPWTELIDSVVNIREDMKNYEICAHILWEITFWGFTEEEIEAQKEATENADNEPSHSFSLNELI